MIGGIDLSNVSSILSIAGSISGICIIVFVPLLRKAKREVVETFNESIDNRVTPSFSKILEVVEALKKEVTTVKGELYDHEKRISKVEGIIEGQKGGSVQ